MSKPTVHLICNAHLDPVWQWRWEEGCAEALATFRTAVDLTGEHPDLIFNHNEAVLYRWVERYDPGLFEAIRERVRRGRWCISGGWFLQPDANLPGLESFFRHIREGRRYFKDRFDASPKTAYNFDSFGHHGGLPQVLRRTGYELYIHMRPEAEHLTLPSDLYRWRGVDGSEILTLRIAVGLYHTERDNIMTRLTEGVRLALERGRDVPVFWGLGNHGGGATREDLARIDDFIAGEDRVRIVHSTTERLLDALREAGRDAPVHEGDLQRVFTGCYTSLSRIKRGARRSLGRLVQAESLATAAWWCFGAPYPEEELDRAWEAHLFNDFHDILPGTCVEPAERDALDGYGRVLEATRRIRLGAMAAFRRARPAPATLPVTVLNSHPTLTRAPVDVEFMADYRPFWDGTRHMALIDEQGREVPCQEEQPEALLPFNAWRRKVSFMADPPALGMAHFRLEARRGEAPDPPPFRPGAEARMDEATGLVTSLKDRSGAGAAAGPALRGPRFRRRRRLVGYGVLRLEPAGRRLRRASRLGAHHRGGARPANRGIGA